MLIDSVYGKDENYYPKVFFKKYYFIGEVFCSNSDEKYYYE